jgi:hypothetical protein
MVSLHFSAALDQIYYARDLIAALLVRILFSNERRIIRIGWTPIAASFSTRRWDDLRLSCLALAVASSVGDSITLKAY